MNPLAKVEIELWQGVVVARVSGELDASNTVAIRDELTAAVTPATRTLVVDLTHLHFIDSSGISALFALSRRLGSRRQKLRVVMPPGSPVRRALDIVRFEQAAPVDATVEEALGACVP